MTGLWAQRFTVLRSVVLLLVARFLVRFIPFSRWRGSLGVVVEGLHAPAAALSAPDPAQLREALRLGRCVMRAAERLPGESRCLPQAMALQWAMKRSGISSDLIIAIHAQDREAEHAYHAWVEHGGEILIGHCEPADYRRVLTISQGHAAPAARA